MRVFSPFACATIRAGENTAPVCAMLECGGLAILDGSQGEAAWGVDTLSCEIASAA